MNGLSNILQKNMENYLYPFFWQHGEDHEILAQYVDKIAESGMNGMCIEARPHPEFAGEGWWQDMDFILGRAKERGMKLWILDDSHFPTGYANGKIKECYPQYLKQYLDMRRYDVQGPLVQARIDFRLLNGRIFDKPDESAEILGVYMAERILDKNKSGNAVNADTLTDITQQMQMKDKLLTVDVPAGAYSIFVVFLTRKGAEETTKDYLNPLIKEATQILLDEVYEPHYAHYGDEFGKTIQGFFSDEPRFGNYKGTEGWIGREDMPLPWRDRLEQELGFEKRFLPLLWIKAEGAESFVRFQYMDIITQLYNANFTKTIGDWCRAHNVFYLGHTIEDNGAHARLGYGTGHYFRGQQDMDAAGIDVIGGQIVPGMNYHHDAFNTGGSNGEFYHYALARLGSSAAHLDPKKAGRAICEAFGAYGWNEGLKTMKWIADHLLVRGINYIVSHAFDPKEFPDWDCPPHFYAHGHNPQFRYFQMFSSYVNRMMSLFRGGMHPAKVGLFYPAESEWAGSYMPVEKPARELTEYQISFDIVSRDFLKTAEIRKGVYVINGELLEVLVFPYAAYIPSDLVPLLRQMADAGIQIIFLEQAPVHTVGIENHDKMLAQVVKDSSVCVLHELGLALEDFQAVKFADRQPDLAVGEYERGGKRFYMLFNENTGMDIHTRAFFNTKGFIYRFDALSDTLYAAEVQDGSVQVNLTPYESAVFIISREPLTAETVEKEGSGLEWKTVPMPEKWEVSYADSFSYPDFQERIPFEQMGLIQQLDGWDKKAGTIRFAAEIDLDEAAGIVLDLGEVHETAEVFVNGVSAGIRMCRPYRFELSGLCKTGRNRLEVEVTNTLGTAVREPLSHYLPIAPFGVQGPVALKIRQ